MNPANQNTVPQQFNDKKRAADSAGEDVNKRQRLTSIGPMLPAHRMVAQLDPHLENMPLTAIGCSIPAYLCSAEHPSSESRTPYDL